MCKNYILFEKYISFYTVLETGPVNEGEPRAIALEPRAIDLAQGKI